MLFSDLRVALFLIYVALVVWRTSVGLPEGYWVYVVAFAGLTGVTRAIEGMSERWRVRRDVAYLTSLDPATAQARIGQLWSAHARRTYRELLRDEGAVEQEAGVERFPYATSERRTVQQLFWVACAAAAVAFVLLFTVTRRGTWVPWVLWAVGSLCVGAAAWTRHRATELASTVEVSPFGVTWVGPDGSRRGARWRHPLILQNQPRRRRVLLAVANDTIAIPLGYRRVGFERLLNLIIEFGGFATVPSTDAARADDSAADA